MLKLDETVIRGIMRDIMIESAEQELDEKYGKMTKKQAQERLTSIEKTHGKTFASKEKAFKWAKDPGAALAALMRKAGKDLKGT